MTRRKRQLANEDLNQPDEAEKENAGLTESTPGVEGPESEVLSSTPDLPEAEEMSGSSSVEEPATQAVQPHLEDSKSSEVEEALQDDPLDLVRQSLVEEEKQGAKKPKGWWRKISKAKKKEKVAEAGEPTHLDSEPTQSPPVAGVVKTQEEGGTSEGGEDQYNEIDELIDALQEPEIASPEPESAQQEAPPEASKKESETSVDIGELKKQALQPRTESARQEVTDKVRSIALQGGEEVLVEVQTTTPDTVGERLSGIENALRPYRRIIYMGIAVLGAVMVVITSILLYIIYLRLQPPKPVVEPNLPYPIMISLPGGLSFDLERGSLDEGQWDPQGPEWLEGTEICRWVAIPWSLQMEAVIRTLNPDDRIELTMSNNDRLRYQVYSVREVRVDELQELDTDTPCLQVVLAKADSEMRWVLTALP